MNMRPKIPSELTQALRKAVSLPYAGRGSVYRMMRDHAAAIGTDIKTYGPRWMERAQAMTDAGLMDEQGKAPSVKAVRLTWRRVLRDIAAQPIMPAHPGQNTPETPGILTKKLRVSEGQLVAKSDPVSNNDSALAGNRVNPSLKAQRLEARVQRLDSKQEAAADPNDEGYSFGYVGERTYGETSDEG